MKAALQDITGTQGPETWQGTVQNFLCLCNRFFVHGSTEIAALLAELADASGTCWDDFTC